MDNYTHDQLIRLRKEAGEARKKRYLEESKKRLFKIVSTKIRTAFVGALAAFEEELGFLWGYDKDGPLTPAEKEYAEIWENVRSKVLTLGNNQIRSVENELGNNTVEWNRYHLDLAVAQPSFQPDCKFDENGTWKPKSDDWEQVNKEQNDERE